MSRCGESGRRNLPTLYEIDEAGRGRSLLVAGEPAEHRVEPVERIVQELAALPVRALGRTIPVGSRSTEGPRRGGGPVRSGEGSVLMSRVAAAKAVASDAAPLRFLLGNVKVTGLGTRDSGLGTRDSGFGIRDSGFGIRGNDLNCDDRWQGGELSIRTGVSLSRDPSIPLARNTHLLRWVEKMRALTRPAAVHWVDGSQEEYDALCAQMVAGRHLHQAQPGALARAASTRARTRATWRASSSGRSSVRSRRTPPGRPTTGSTPTRCGAR